MSTATTTVFTLLAYALILFMKSECCIDRTPEEMNRIVSSKIYPYNPATFLQADSLFELNQNHSLMINHFIPVREMAMSNDTNCPEWSSLYDYSRKGFELKHRSLCPWYYKLTLAEDRWPKFMMEAECRCSNCVLPVGSESVGCEKIYTLARVLQRTTCANGMWNYVPKYQKVAIGCACAFARF